MTSPKDKFKNKKSAIDFIKVFDEKSKDTNRASKLIGVLNINNMIPIDVSVINKVDLSIYENDVASVKKHKALMQKQIKWCRQNYDVIQNRANKVYSIVTETPEKNRDLVSRCCDFVKLEKVLDKYMAKLKITDN